MSELIDTTEMYLRTVFELQEEGIPPLRARIAERLAQSGPTVSQTVARMERDGLLHVGEDRQIHLTAAGRSASTRVMRKHRLAECMLVDLLGMDWDLTHAEACRWEHVISDDVERLLMAALGQPEASPFGQPIPGLSELDPEARPGPAAAEGVPLTQIAGPHVRQARILSIGESAQADPTILSTLRRVGAQPGGLVQVRRVGDHVMVGSTGEYAEIEEPVASHITALPIAAAQDA
ncbi:MAG: metal-dependent transcriptional regulator [Candidatus Nanopelagicales bacterium]|nr:metal-dependent transcriptional regulator [Candidatus Nanopelagicales bacterium]